MAISAHPYAELFPMLSDADGAGLRRDLTTNGQRERIVLLDGQVLDGRNRQRQLEALGLVDGEVPADDSDLWISRYRRFNPAQDGDALAFVLSLNLHRRHLNESQRSMVAASIANMGQGARTDLTPDSNQPSANLPKVSQADAAQMLQVSTRSVTAAAKVQTHGAPELVAAVRSGDVPVSAGADATKLSVGEQLRLLREQSPRGFAAAVRTELSKPRDARAVMNSRVQPPDDLDYAPTPPWATRALLQIVLPHLGQSLAGCTVREPSCGEGHISAVLQEARPRAIWASDIFDYSVDGVSPPGWVGTFDYLDIDAPLEPADWTVMNSPFEDKAEKFVHRARRESGVGVAAFVRMTWLSSVGRYQRLFGETPPTLIAIFSERVPLHMGRWDPDGSTATDYIWLVWVHGKAPLPPFWIPPGQKLGLTKSDDVPRFTAHPVVGLVEAGAAAAALSAAIAIPKSEALEIIKARYTGDNGQQLADELGRPLNTVRKWAWEAGVSNQANSVGRALANLEKINRERTQ